VRRSMKASKMPKWASYSTAARWLALSAATFTAVLTLWSPTSVAARVAGESEFAELSSIFTLALCAIGWADVFWHDFRGRLIWPGFPLASRHKVCVLLYMLLAATFFQRAFVSAGGFAMLAPFYYLSMGAGIGITAIAVAVEERT